MIGISKWLKIKSHCANSVMSVYCEHVYLWISDVCLASHKGYFSSTMHMLSIHARAHTHTHTHRDSYPFIHSSIHWKRCNIFLNNLSCLAVFINHWCSLIHLYILTYQLTNSIIRSLRFLQFCYKNIVNKI